MSLFRKKPKSQGERLGAWRIDAIASRDFDREIEALFAELDVPAKRERQGWVATVGGDPLLLNWLDEDRVLTGLAFLEDTSDARELTDLLRGNLDPRLVWYALGDAEEPSLAARFKLPFDAFDRGGALLAVETTAALLGDDGVAARARELRGPPAGEMEEQRADARTRDALAAGLEEAGLAATQGDGRLEVEVDRGVVHAIPRDTGESVLFMHELEYGDGTEHVPMLRWMLETSDWCGARLGLAPLPGGEGAFAASAVPAIDLRPQAVAWGVEQVLRLADAYDEKTGARVSVGMVVTIAFFALLVFGYLYAVGKVWRGESEFDGQSPPAFWPFSLALWRGAGRALPVLGLSTLLVIGTGIASDLIGSDSRYYDTVMAVGFGGLLVTCFVAFPIMYYNRPKLLVPPPWRDDPGAVAEWRAARARR